LLVKSGHGAVDSPHIYRSKRVAAFVQRFRQAVELARSTCTLVHILQACVNKAFLPNTATTHAHVGGYAWFHQDRGSCHNDMTFHCIYVQFDIWCWTRFLPTGLTSFPLMIRECKCFRKANCDEFFVWIGCCIDVRQNRRACPITDEFFVITSSPKDCMFLQMLLISKNITLFKIYASPISDLTFIWIKSWNHSASELYNLLTCCLIFCCEKLSFHSSKMRYWFVLNGNNVFPSPSAKTRHISK